MLATPYPPAQQTRQWREGYDAYCAGKTTWSNPYLTSSQSWTWWLGGWEQAAMGVETRNSENQ